MTLIDPAKEDLETAPVTVTVTLENDAAALWNELSRRTGCEAFELVGWALGAYWREMEGVVLPPAQTEEEVEQMIAEGLEDIRAGRTVSNEDVFARLDVKHGW